MTVLQEDFWYPTLLTYYSRSSISLYSTYEDWKNKITPLYIISFNNVDYVQIVIRLRMRAVYHLPTFISVINLNIHLKDSSHHHFAIQNYADLKHILDKISRLGILIDDPFDVEQMIYKDETTKMKHYKKKYAEYSIPYSAQSYIPLVLPLKDKEKGALE